jgi:hypothetical protein
MTKPTRGPWEVFQSANRGKAVQISVPLDATENAGEYIATCMGANRKANAQLIAAAPELLEALAQTIESLEYAVRVLQAPTRSHIRETLEQAKQALNKAKGVTND